MLSARLLDQNQDGAFMHEMFSLRRQSFWQFDKNQKSVTTASEKQRAACSVVRNWIENTCGAKTKGSQLITMQFRHELWQLVNKKIFLKLVCNFAMICDTLGVGQKRVICRALHKAPFQWSRIRPTTIFDPRTWPALQQASFLAVKILERGGDAEVGQENIFLWSFQLLGEKLMLIRPLLPLGAFLGACRSENGSRCCHSQSSYLSIKQMYGGVVLIL